MIIPTSGPDMAKSKSELEFGGGDLMGVMHPKEPSCKDGTIVGAPALNCSHVKL